MGRWRPPQGEGGRYITAEGFAALEREARALWTRRAEVVVHLSAAAAEGDRSENAEYQYRKKELREIDRRIGYLNRRMPRLTIVREAPPDLSRVFFGAEVELESLAGERYHYRIVGADEARPEDGSISMDAPLARKLLGRAIDDEVELLVQGETRFAEIVAIRYPGQDSNDGPENS